MTKKEDVLYLGLVNITAGSDLTEQLTTGFAEAQGLTKKQQVDLLSGLLLSESDRAEEQYVYASEMKLLGAVSAQRLDVVLMDEYARDRLLADDYFLDLRTLDASFRALSGLNAGGTVLDISDTPFVRQAGFSGKVYLGGAECTAPGACSRLHSLSVPAVIVGFHIKNKEKYHGHFNDW